MTVGRTGSRFATPGEGMVGQPQEEERMDENALPSGFSEVRGSPSFKFERDGDTLEGRLLSRDTVELDGKTVLEYEFELDRSVPEVNARVVRVLALSQLKWKLATVRDGARVYVKRLGMKTPPDGGLPYTDFLVGVDRGQART